MRVKVEAIREKGLELEEPLSPALVEKALEATTGFKLVRAGQLKAKFDKVGTEVLVKASMDLELEAPCKRCVDPVKFTLPVSFALDLVPESELRESPDDEGEDDGGGERAGTFAFDDADQEPFDGKRVEMDPFVSEQLVLALPVSGVVCRDDCKGLCTVCGNNLNERECGCERKPVDVRLLKLKDIKLQS
jgi:uncharacterized protein